MSRCDSCKYPYDIRKWPCDDCLQGDKYKPKLHTNADHIRAMTDEELAEFLGENDSYFPIGDHKKYWLDWLRQETKKGEI